MKKSRHLHISDESYIQRYKYGVKLITSDELEIAPSRSLHSVKSTQAFPFCVYFLNTHSEHQYLNAHSAETCRFSSIKDAIGKSISENLTIQSAQRILNNDLETLQSNRIKIVEEPVSYHDEYSIEGLGIKMPWYNSDDEIIGIFGCSIVYGVHSIPDFLKKVMALSLFSPVNHQIQLVSNINGIYISKREREVLKYTLKGKTAKQVASVLYVSQKTVEFHLDNLKIKFGCFSKSELIETVINYLTTSD